MNDETTYCTFLRSANSFAELANAEKIPQDSGLTLKQARANCQEFNTDRSEAEIAAGTKMEFTEE
jgi:hypothetical protein